jgi:hypothetical protein
VCLKHVPSVAVSSSFLSMQCLSPVSFGCVTEGLRCLSIPRSLSPASRSAASGFALLSFVPPLPGWPVPVFELSLLLDGLSTWAAGLLHPATGHKVRVVLLLAARCPKTAFCPSENRLQLRRAAPDPSKTFPLQQLPPASPQVPFLLAVCHPDSRRIPCAAAPRL